MSRIWFMFAGALSVLAFVACNAIASSPEPVARTAAEQFLQKQGIPYKDVSLQTLKNDGTYATVRVVAWLRPSAQSDWVEQYADIEVRNVGGQWQTAAYMTFQLGEREQKKIQDQQNATATAWANERATQVAVATASASATQQAQAVALKSIEVLKIDSVEYVFSEYSCSYPFDFQPGCRLLEARRITFSIRNDNTRPHKAKVTFTIQDSANGWEAASYFAYDTQFKAEPTWEGDVGLGVQTIRFDGAPRFFSEGYRFTVYPNREFTLTSTAWKIVSVDGIEKK